MNATEKTAKVIGLWWDETSDPGHAAWIVSRDKMNERGEAVTTDTVKYWSVPDDEHENGEKEYALAREFALGLARKEGICVIETGLNGQECLYAPDDVDPIVGCRP